MTPQFAELTINLPEWQTLLKYALAAIAAMALVGFAGVPAARTIWQRLRARITQARALKTQNLQPHNPAVLQPTNKTEPDSIWASAAAYAQMIVRNSPSAPAEIQLSYILKGLEEMQVLRAEITRLSEAVQQQLPKPKRTMHDPPDLQRDTKETPQS